MLHNVETTNVVTNMSYEEVTIPPGYYSIDKIIPILTNISDTTFFIFTKTTSYLCIIYMIPNHRLYQCSGYTRNNRFGSTNSHSICFVLWIKRDLYHAKSPSNPSKLVPSAIFPSGDCQPVH